MSSAPASLAEPVTLIAVPSGLVSGVTPMAAIGLALFTITVLLLAATALPSLSVTVSVTTNVPLSLGVNVKVEATPLLYATPFFVTAQA